ncbi:hypothetical protein ACHAXT_011800 [Thalassiosira profunda]
MDPPTLAQQRGLAFAPIPFASISLLASLYIIHHLLCRERQRLKRMYHRLVLALNLSLVVVSVMWIWSPFSVPEGTPYFAGASGTVQTCTANAFIFAVFSLAIPAYYGSLSFQAFMGIRHNFKEEKYRWIEKWIHCVSLIIPTALASIIAATENFNPTGTGCYVGKYPRGCETDPDVPCERGDDIWHVEFIIGLGLICLYFVFPPAIVLGMYCWIRKAQKRVDGSTGMKRLRESARRQMMGLVAKQISIYLFSFWFTWIFSLIHQAIFTITDTFSYSFLIFANCINASQGFVFAGVYFALQRMGQPREVVERNTFRNTGLSTASSPPGMQRELTVAAIRTNAESRDKTNSEASAEDRRESYAFNIFDGVPDEDSPWAKYITMDDSDRNQAEDTPDLRTDEEADAYWGIGPANEQRDMTDLKAHSTRIE